MSTGTQIAIGVALGLVVFVLVRALRQRASSPGPPASAPPLTGDLETRLRSLLAAGKKINAIKELREHTHMGLKEAKEYVETLSATGEPPVARPVAGVGEETLARARALVAEGKFVHAVKAVREETGWDLRRSKDVVDRLKAEQPKRRDDGFGYGGL